MPGKKVPGDSDTHPLVHSPPPRNENHLSSALPVPPGWDCVEQLIFWIGGEANSIFSGAVYMVGNTQFHF